MTTGIIEYSKTDAALADLASRYKGVVFDVTTREGMEAARKGRAELRGYRVDLEKVRVEIKAPALERCRLIDAEAKRISAALEALEDPIDSTIKLEEKRKEREAMEAAMAEQRRKDALLARIAEIRQLPSACVGKSSAQLLRALEEATALTTIGPDFGEFRVEAEDALKSALAQMSVMLSGVQAQEAEAERIKAERAELAKLRAADEQRERDRQAQIADENRIRAEEAAEARRVIEAEQRASREKIEAEERAARQARVAEEAKLHAEREAADAERRKMDAEQREIQRKANEIQDAYGLLATFTQRFGHMEQFAPIIAAIASIVPKKRKAA